MRQASYNAGMGKALEVHARLAQPLSEGTHLFHEEDRADMAYLMRGRILIAQALYAAATLLCVVFPTWVSIALIILIQVNYVLAPRIPILNRF